MCRGRRKDSTARNGGMRPRSRAAPWFGGELLHQGAEYRTQPCPLHNTLLLSGRFEHGPSGHTGTEPRIGGHRTGSGLRGSEPRIGPVGRLTRSHIVLVVVV